MIRHYVLANLAFRLLIDAHGFLVVTDCPGVAARLAPGSSSAYNMRHHTQEMVSDPLDG